MKGYEAWLVRYVVGDVDQELIIPHENYVERRLVLLTQDEMMMQANDITSKMWVFRFAVCLVVAMVHVPVLEFTLEAH
jgi:hypothetical protein